MTLDEAVREIRTLAPLNEARVSRFEELVIQLADQGTIEAASALFDVLDDECPLGGVMLTVSNRLQEFPPEVLVGALANAAESTTRRAPHGLQNVLRAIVLSPECSSSLRVCLAKLDASERTILVRHLEHIAQSDTYRRACAAVLDE